MNILVTNDDGINSMGLWTLADAMSKLGNVLVVAPVGQQSGVGSSISLRGDMSIKEMPNSLTGIKAYAIGGTPSDCVMLGISRLSGGNIDLVVSGINTGPNVGRDIPYSGTVMATLQGYYKKIPSMAVSLFPQTLEEELNFEVAAQVAEMLAQNIKNRKIITGAILNVNVPNIPLEQIRGIKTTRTASTGYVKIMEEPVESFNYSVKHLDNSTHQTIEEDTDIWAIHAGFISITPLRFEVTHHEVIPSLSEAIQEMGSEFRKSQPKMAL